MALKPKQEQAIIALMQHPTVVEAAKASGVGERTLWRWIGEPEFAMALTHAESGAIDETTRRLVQLQTSATEVLQTVLDSTEAKDDLRVRAAGMVLDYSLKLRELRNIELRLMALEVAAQHGKK